MASLDGERTLVDAVISDLPGGVLVVDRDGKVVHANRTARRILTGSDESEPPPLAGRLLQEIRAPLDAMRRAAHKAEIVVPPVVVGEPARIIGFSSRPLLDGAMVVSFADITDQRAREREDEHRRRLIDMGKVISSVAHEIRNPVFAISSLTQVLREENTIQTDGELMRVVERILAETGRIGRLVEDLLAFGRERDPNPRRVDVVREIEEALTDLRNVLPRVEGIRVPLRLHVAPSLKAEPHWVVDADSLRQVVVNLVRNAWRAVVLRGGGSEGLVEIRMSHHGDEHGEPWLEVAVSDNGIGIPAELRKKIFDAFYTRDPKGTGLGLAVVRRLMQQLGGTIRLHSEVDRGTTFVMRLPPPEDGSEE
ncbi:sensor histidine kinase [Paraliomyxa miuraensis]|uniref:sensor histidine kinase n=1 Tax=Paraliomyxa miuraensis TaxID=376150 RepID=UPI0022540760|nr:ATP-binding protein [Paraliomyxa miuraensis]MCX4247207.1 ATP-binding protein [Paraliomyxa miuraensis]